MNGSPGDQDWIRDKPRPSELTPMRRAVEAELRRQRRESERLGYIGNELSSDAEAGPKARVCMYVNMDELAAAVVAHFKEHNHG